jgi:regulator of protease activity HflC (stomatin/prohibitin superfamily)
MDIASVVKGIATLSWLLVIGAIVLVVVRATRARPVKRAAVLVSALVAFAIILTLVGAGLVFLQPEERGIVISPYDSQGYRTESLGPGLHWIIPGETVTLYPISRQTYTMSASASEGNMYGDDSIRARTKDGQEVFIDASVIYSIDPTNIIQLHITWQGRYQDELVRPLARGIIRDMASQYGVEEIVSSKRIELEAKVTEELTAKMGENSLTMVDFVLRDIHFSDEYAAAVEQKQIAEQLALQAQFIVEQKKQEAEQARQVAQGVADAVVIQAKGDAEARVIQATAEAEAMDLIAQVLKDNPGLLTYQYILKLAPNVKVIILPGSSNFILPPELVIPQ